MPASMMSAGTAGKLKVIGNSMAIVASGPMPGSTPISVPTSTPMKQSHPSKGDLGLLELLFCGREFILSFPQVLGHHADLCLQFLQP